MIFSRLTSTLVQAPSSAEDETPTRHKNLLRTKGQSDTIFSGRRGNQAQQIFFRQSSVPTNGSVILLIRRSSSLQACRPTPLWLIARRPRHIGRPPKPL